VADLKGKLCGRKNRFRERKRKAAMKREAVKKELRTREGAKRKDSSPPV